MVLEKGDYFKLDNVTLGYTFIPQKRNLLESLRVYLSAKNLFTLTGYKGNDPSIVTSTGITPGIDSNSAYPQAFQVIVRIGLGKVELVALFGPVGIPAVVPALDQHASQAMAGSKVDVTLGILGGGTVALAL